jgi:acetyl esterase/lipase
MSYGDRPREVMDIIWPDETPKGLIVFIHGGYWMRLDKSSWTDLAEGARANGWAVCLPSYDLTPDARISQITQQIGAAISVAAACVDGPIHLAGHSAGGHLATRMVCDDTPLKPEALARVRRVLSISGLHDLRPLLRTKMNDVLKLDEAEACAESAALHRPAIPHKLTCWVGGGERPEFIRQSKLLAHMWAGLDVDAECVLDQQHNHFSVIDDLKHPRSAITQALCACS